MALQFLKLRNLISRVRSSPAEESKPAPATQGYWDDHTDQERQMAQTDKMSTMSSKGGRGVQAADATSALMGKIGRQLDDHMEKHGQILATHPETHKSLLRLRSQVKGVTRRAALFARTSKEMASGANAILVPTLVDRGTFKTKAGRPDPLRGSVTSVPTSKAKPLFVRPKR